MPARKLQLIEDLLADDRWLPRLPGELQTAYLESLDQLYRRTNRIAVAVFTIVFDLFLFAQLSTAPELVPLSALLRLAVYTPAAAAFVWLDLTRHRLARAGYAGFLLVLAVAPGIITLMLCVRTTSTTSLSDVHATTLILLGVGLIFRMRLPAVLLTAAVSFAAFLTGLLLTPVIPRAELPSLIITDFAIAAAVTVFSILLDRRDRLVFLLNLREQTRASLLALRNEGLQQAAELDALTGLANRRCFDARLDGAWQAARALGLPVGLIMLDVDHFKRFNDRYGHLRGDDCLRRVAETARRETRGGDLMARYGGEEFAVILPGAPLAAVTRVAERIRVAVAQMELPHEGVGPRATLSVSLGAASLVPADDEAPTRLIEAADQHLYGAKRAGRNRVCTGERGPPAPAPAPAESATAAA